MSAPSAWQGPASNRKPEWRRRSRRVRSPVARSARERRPLTRGTRFLDERPSNGDPKVREGPTGPPPHVDPAPRSRTAGAAASVDRRRRRKRRARSLTGCSRPVYPAVPASEQTAKWTASLSLRSLCVPESHEHPRNAANPDPRASAFSGGFRGVFARVRRCSGVTNQSERTVRVGLLMRFSGRLLRICSGHTGLMPGAAPAQSERMPCLTFVSHARWPGSLDELIAHDGGGLPSVAR